MGLLKDINLGKYVEGESIIHRLDPRIKLISLALLALALVFYKGNLSLLSFFLFLGLTLFLSKIPWPLWYKNFKLFIWFFIALLIINTWAGYLNLPSSIPPFYKFKGGFCSGLVAVIRWGILIGFCFLLTMTTRPLELTHGFESLLSPLKRFGLPVHEMSLMAGLAFYFLPILKEEAEKQIAIQTVTPEAEKEKGYIDNIQRVIEVIPAFIQGLYQQAEIMAMEIEGKKEGEKNGICPTLHPIDKKALFYIIFFLLILWCANRYISF